MTNPIASDEPFNGAATSEATWRGGPWDGVSMTVIVGERFFPLYGDPRCEDDSTFVPAPRRITPSRRCPIRPGPDGHLVIDWNAGTDQC